MIAAQFILFSYFLLQVFVDKCIETKPKLVTDLAKHNTY